MARKTDKELNELMKQEDVSRLWSWSRVHCFMNSPYEYFLKYVQNVKEDRQDCIYTTTGGLCHDIIERYYTNQIMYGDMINEFEDGWTVAYDVAQLKFDRNDEEHNKKIAGKYYECLQHFFKNHKVLEHKPAIEQFVKVKVGDNLLQGYIDCCFKDDDGCYNIVDWKTSSIYKGAKAQEECGQLALYAIGLNQMGVPLDKIKICWNFLKYCSVQYEQANGTIKSREVERCKIGESLQSNAKMWLNKLGYEDEIDDYLKLLIDTNNIEVLPSDVQEKYIITDCYVYVDVKPDILDHWNKLVIDTINDILLREKDYEETKSDKCFWDSDDSVEKQSYYFSTLCSYSPSLHKPYAAYLDKLEASKNGLDLFDGVNGNDSANVVKTNNVICNNDNEIDLSWLDEIE
jgi:hypothetical protein